MYQTDISVAVIISVPLIGGLLALAFNFYLKTIVDAASRGDPQKDALQIKIADIVQDGAIAFLKEEYMWLCPFVAFMAVFFFIEEGITCENGSGTKNEVDACNNAEFPGNGGYRLSICFIIGAILSAAAGYAGMLVATDCNVKAAEAAKDDKEGLNNALTVAFAGGAVMGFTVVGLGLTGLTVLFMLFAQVWDHTETDQGMSDRYSNIKESLNYMAGFSFGASAIALFARVAGGIYTKAADVGADLVGKVEEDFPEDSFYNPATIADNVGDNVGDVAGMGADLFESYVGSIVGCATLALSAHTQSGGAAGPDFRRVALPFWVSGFGVLASIMGFFFVNTNAKMEDENGRRKEAGEVLAELLYSLHKGVYSSSVFIVIFTVVCVIILYEGDNGCDASVAAYNCGTTQFFTYGFEAKEGWKDLVSMVIGLLTGIIIGEATEYFTSYEHSPTQSITKSGVTGPATVIIQGLGIGMLSAVPPVIVIAVAIMSTTALSGVYGAGIAAVGMLSTLGVTLATDAYGPVADNAGGNAEMSHMPESVRAKTDALDALGNTTAATGKGFAVGSAVLTALAFMNAFSDGVQKQVSTSEWNNGAFFALTDPLVLSGLLIGAMLPFLFAALTMLSVGKAATGIILEVRRQLREFPLLCELAIMTSTEDFVTVPDANGKLGLDKLTEEQKACEPDSPECVRICTVASLYEMLLPGVLAILTPIGVGLLVGAKCLGGLLMGAIATGFLLAVMMNNAGGAWDNSKKFVENDNPPLGDWKRNVVHEEKAKAKYKTDSPTEEQINDIIFVDEDTAGKVWKKSVWHAAVVTGDTVGDPFKDTSGPALNILIKLMSVLSLTTVKIYRDDWETYWVGIIVLIVEAVLCGVIFYYVWWNDDTMEAVNKNPMKKDEKKKKDEKASASEAGTGVEMDETTPAPAPEEAATPEEAAAPENTA